MAKSAQGGNKVPQRGTRYMSRDPKNPGYVITKPKKQGTSDGYMKVSSLKPAKAKGEAWDKFENR